MLEQKSVSNSFPSLLWRGGVYVPEFLILADSSPLAIGYGGVILFQFPGLGIKKSFNCVLLETFVLLLRAAPRDVNASAQTAGSRM